MWRGVDGHRPDSVKVADFRENPKAGLCYQKDGSNVCLRGMVEIIDDAAVRAEKWRDCT